MSRCRFQPKVTDTALPPVTGVLVLTQIINPFRTIPFNMKDQFGLAYGGLRGAISFALAFTLPENIGRKQLFITATIAVILFTVFLQVRGGLGDYTRDILRCFLRIIYLLNLSTV